MDIININGLLEENAIVSTLQPDDFFILSRYSPPKLTGSHLGHKTLAITKSDLVVALGGGYNRAQNQGVNVPQRTTFNFVGAGVVTSDIAGVTTITIPGNSIETLATTLVAGNFTGGTNINITSGDTIHFSRGAGGSLNNVPSLGIRTWDLPDASGVIALVSQIPVQAFVNNGNSFGGLATLGTIDNQDLAIITNGTEITRFLKTGEFGIGLNNPTAKLHIMGAGTTTATYNIKAQNSTGDDIFSVKDNGQTIIKNPTGSADLNIYSKSGYSYPTLNLYGQGGAELASIQEYSDRLIFLATPSQTVLGSWGTAGLGIGTGYNAASAQLHVSGGHVQLDGNCYLTFNGDYPNSVGLITQNGGGSMGFYSGTLKDLFVGTNYSNSVKIWGINQNVGIANSLYVGNTVSQPTAMLQVDGDALIHTLTIGLGSGSIASNTVVGFQSLINNTTGANNSAFGYQSGNSQIVANGNSYFGYRAGLINTGSENSFFGLLTGGNGVLGSRNVFLGSRAGEGNASTDDCIGIGYNAYAGNVSGYQNIAIGTNAMGYAAAITGSSNIAIGLYSMLRLTSGLNNNAVGYASLNSNTTGNSNSAFGYNSLAANISGGENSAFGYYGGQANNGSNNIFLGAYAGAYRTADSNRLFIDSSGGRGSAANDIANALIWGVFAAAPTNQELHFNARIIDMANLQTGNAGLTTGQLYVDLSANILSNGDLVVGRKV